MHCSARSLVAAVVAAATLLVPPLAAAVVPTTTRVGVSSTGVQASSNAEFPVVSQNGRWTAFQSTASNLVTGDTKGLQDVFVHDAKTGQTVRIQEGATEPDGASANPSISGDGRWVVFESRAKNLVATTSTSSQIYLFDRLDGSLKRLSQTAAGVVGGADSFDPRMSSDGAAVVFYSNARLVASDTDFFGDVYLYRLSDGSITRVSEPVGVAPDAGTGTWAAVSNGGRFVAFSSFATNLVTGDIGGNEDVFLRDIQTGAIVRASVTSAGGEANSDSYDPSISADGCIVVFHTAATNLVAGSTLAGAKTIARDRCAGTTEFASLTGAATPAPGTVLDERPPAVSDDGCLVGMISSTLAATSGWRGVFVRDRCNGTTTRIDISTDGQAGLGHTNGPSFSAGSARYVAFHSGAGNLVGGTDANGALSDAFVRDRANATPPIADLEVSASARQVTADASGSTDPDAGIASISISFGDGTPAVAGTTLVHDYTQVGTFTVTATVTDTDGLTSVASQSVTVTDVIAPPLPPAPPPPPPPGAGRAPKLTKASLDASRFVVVPRGKRPGKGRGAKLSVTTSEAATLTLAYERVVSGRRKGGRCVPAARTGKRCTAFRKAGSPFTTPLITGVNRITLTGRTPKGALAPGGYRLRLVARTADGRVSKPVRLRLTIVLP
ncbi:MAG: PKD domain-containing protein [Thermoleophilia bacterium]